jgi:hypothetical protein
MAFDLDLGVYGGQKNGRRMEDAWMKFQLLTASLRVTETFILVLPANTGIGENNGCRWKEIRFEASQHPRLAHNMTPSEHDLLCTWAKQLHKFEVRYCWQLEDFKSYDKFESFEAVGLGLAYLWEMTNAISWRSSISSFMGESESLYLKQSDDLVP